MKHQNVRRAGFSFNETFRKKVIRKLLGITGKIDGRFPINFRNDGVTLRGDSRRWLTCSVEVKARILFRHSGIGGENPYTHYSYT